MAFSILRRASAGLFRAQITKKPFQLAYLSDHERNMIGRREIVGYGINGQPSYADLTDFPFPAIRWKEPTPEIEALREKEKGDWNELTCEEKKALYRYSFCQTYEEMKVASLGEWKSVTGTILMLMAGSIWLFFYFKLTIYRAFPMPHTFQEENRKAMFRRWIDLRANPVEGLASKWDYEKDDWKDPKDPWRSK